MNVKAIRNQFEKNDQVNEISKPRSHNFILQRCKTSLEPFNLQQECSNSKFSKPKKRTFQKSKTSLDLLLSNSNDITSCSGTSRDFLSPALREDNKPSETRMLLNRQLSDPLKKGNIKRTPAFRCDKTMHENNGGNSKMSISSKIRMYEQSQSKNVHALSKPVLHTQINNTNYNNGVALATMSQDNRINGKHSALSVNQRSPMGYNVKSDLYGVAHQIHLSKQSVVKGNDNVTPSSTSSSSSSSPTEFSSGSPPKYSQVIKSKKLKYNLQTPSINKSTMDLISDDLSDELKNTLKKALKSPLPEGPPPKKPPRTFAHSNILKHRNNQIQTIDETLTCNNATVDIASKTIKSRGDPKLMLAKLENALLNNKLKSPKAIQKTLQAENIRLCENPGSKITNIRSNTKINNDSNQKHQLFNDCFPMCTSNEYMRPNLSKSEFFIDRQKPNDLGHIYAEPFEFTHNVPVKKKCKPSIEPVNCFDTMATNQCSRISNPNRDTHYLCTPIQRQTSQKQCTKTSEMDRVYKDVNVNELAEDSKPFDTCYNKNRLPVEQPCNVATNPHNKSVTVTNGNTSSVLSKLPSPHIQSLSQHQNSNYAPIGPHSSLTAAILQMGTSSGRVRALVKKLETFHEGLSPDILNLESHTSFSLPSTINN